MLTRQTFSVQELVTKEQ